MAFDGATTNAQLDASLNAVVLLDSSCQAVIEAEVQDVGGDWYTQLDQELGAAEELVIAWRRGGVGGFTADVLTPVGACGAAFASGRAAIDAAYAALEQEVTPDGVAHLTAALNGLTGPLQAVADGVGEYQANLKAFASSMLTAEEHMNATIAAVQAQASQIQAQIATINEQITSLQQQIATDRAAIAQAKSEETTGIVETIFGVLLAPITGGASLILAGIGVASIGQAESLIDGMEATISGYQQTIAGDQANLSQDQQAITALNGLTLSANLVLGDLTSIDTALDSLRATWSTLGGELANTLAELGSATLDTDQVAVSHAWFDAACLQWSQVASHVTTLAALPLTTSRRRVG